MSERESITLVVTDGTPRALQPFAIRVRIGLKLLGRACGLRVVSITANESEKVLQAETRDARVLGEQQRTPSPCSCDENA